ncbi:MAG: CooT family nickel-binding protein [Mogibacterium sp.]|nr:CooT family nickel-binding protein [Mogibacterium sp.]
MCLSNVYRNSVDDSNLLARNVADIKIENGKIIFTDIMGIRTAFDGSLE